MISTVTTESGIDTWSTFTADCFDQINTTKRNQSTQVHPKPIEIRIMEKEEIFEKQYTKKTAIIFSENKTFKLKTIKFMTR